ncbi:MAG: hypothetical protein EYC62_05945 [Alphaproteobacteria bacterium]|nr:MAG: hypothetical protein EYC62_05945 [Alphaproteobacteria bacterium]
MAKTFRKPIAVSAHMPSPSSTAPTAVDAKQKPQTPSADLVGQLAFEAEVIARLQNTPSVMRAKMFTWIKMAGENINHPGLDVEGPKKAIIAQASYSFASYMIAHLGKDGEKGIPANRDNLFLIGKACHFSAKHVTAGAKKSKNSPMTLAEEAAGIVQQLDQQHNLRTFPSDALLDMAATLRIGCTKLPDRDLGDILGIQTWAKIIGILCDRLQVIQMHPADWAPKRTAAEIQAMKSYLRGQPEDVPFRQAELESLHATRGEVLTRTVFPLGTQVKNRPNIFGGMVNSVVRLFGAGPREPNG